MTHLQETKAVDIALGIVGDSIKKYGTDITLRAIAVSDEMTKCLMKLRDEKDGDKVALVAAEFLGEIIKRTQAATKNEVAPLPEPAGLPHDAQPLEEESAKEPAPSAVSEGGTAIDPRYTAAP